LEFLKAPKTFASGWEIKEKFG